MKAFKKYFLLFVGFVFINSQSLLCQPSKVDSLKLQLQDAKHDSSRCKILDEIVYYTSNDFDVWPEYNKKQTELCENNLKTEKGKYKNFYLKYLAVALNKSGFHSALNGDIAKALDYFERSLKIKEAIGDKLGASFTLQNIGVEYYKQGDIKTALNYFERCAKIQEECNSPEGLAGTLNNLGVIYFKQKNNLKALESFNKSLRIREELGSKTGIGTLLNNIGNIYETQGDLNLALEYYQKSHRSAVDLKDKVGLCSSYNRYAEIYFKLGLIEKSNKASNKNYKKAYFYSDSSLLMAKEIGFPENIKLAELTLCRLDSATGNYLGAYKHYAQFIIFRDSIANESNRKASIKNQLKYEYNKKEAVLIEQQEKEKIIAEEKNRLQHLIIVSVVIGLLLVIIFAGFIFQTLKTTRKQKEIIEEKQKEILDSIYYARRIQQSLLPNDVYLQKHLPQAEKLK